VRYCPRARRGDRSRTPRRSESARSRARSSQDHSRATFCQICSVGLSRIHGEVGTASSRTGHSDEFRSETFYRMLCVARFPSEPYRPTIDRRPGRFGTLLTPPAMAAQVRQRVGLWSVYSKKATRCASATPRLGSFAGGHRQRCILWCHSPPPPLCSQGPAMSPRAPLYRLLPRDLLWAKGKPLESYRVSLPCIFHE
jgi:hypothetical protein